MSKNHIFRCIFAFVLFQEVSLLDEILHLHKPTKKIVIRRVYSEKMAAEKNVFNGVK